MQCLKQRCATLFIGISHGPAARTLLRGHRAASTSSVQGVEDCFDVVIVGGGMVGAAVAALLGAQRLTSQLRVAVLDVKPQPTSFHPRPVPDLRVSTVTPGSIEVLRRAGAWEEVREHSASFSSMQVWDTSSAGYIRWDARDAGAERMGVVAENTALQAALLAAALRSGGRIEFLWPAEVKALRLPVEEQGLPAAAPAAAAGAAGSVSSVSSSSGSSSPARSPPGHGLAELELSDGRVLTSRLVVAADGAASRVRQMAGLRTWGWGYGQRGLVASVATSEPSDTAWQRFLPTGPLALLPVRDGFSNIVWSTTPDMARELEGMGPDEFAEAVNRALRDPPTSSLSPPAGLAGPLSSLAASVSHLRSRLGPEGGGWASGGSHDAAAAALGFREPPLVTSWVGSPPRSFPLQLKQAGRYVLPRLALVGDAAHAVHPMAGQGVNLGFGDARVLAEALAAAVEAGGDPGDARMLAEAYEAPRRRSVMTMTTALDAIKKAFEIQAPPLAALRGLGLSLINLAGPVRNGIMSYAMMGEV